MGKLEWFYCWYNQHDVGDIAHAHRVKATNKKHAAQTAAAGCAEFIECVVIGTTYKSSMELFVSRKLNEEPQRYSVSLTLKVEVK